ncbi:MAG: hypothetical protein F9K32_15225 [Desulfobulbaceae bacterium]|nr:MAG: hypothetical protein F9K32_15225 [Desulfobulbaceae bacterium]
MKYTLSYDQKRDIIVGRIEGEMVPALVKEMASEFAGLVRSSGCHRLLNDLRGARITPSTFDIYSMPRIVDERELPLTCRRALVISEEAEDFRFLETVSVNYGQQVRIFTDPAAAVEWLTVDKASPGEPDPPYRGADPDIQNKDV